MKEKKTMSSIREKMLARKKSLESRGGGSIFFLKEGTTRLRLMNQGPDKELGLEVIQFYLPGKGGYISPATFGEPCPMMERYQELKNSKNEEDMELAKALAPRKRYIVGGTLYKDQKGKEVDTDNICKPILIPRAVYQDIVDLFLDEDDWGDPTDEREGYDIKITRSGKGKMDTNYTVTACPGKGPIDPKYRKEMDLEQIIGSNCLPYEELEKVLNEWMNGPRESTEPYNPLLDEGVAPISEEKKKKKKKKVKDI